MTDTVPATAEAPAGELPAIDLQALTDTIDYIRPALQADGGNIELVEVGEDGVVKVRLMGACGSCPMSQLTLKRGVEARLKAKVPEVKEVVSV